MLRRLYSDYLKGLNKLAIAHINSGIPTTSTIINKLLLNQNLSVTAEKLKKLLDVKGVEIEIPITEKGRTKLSLLTGKSAYRGFFGVYVFTDKITGFKYVGSSNLLIRRSPKGESII